MFSETTNYFEKMLSTDDANYTAQRMLILLFCVILASGNTRIFICGTPTRPITRCLMCFLRLHSTTCHLYNRWEERTKGRLQLFHICSLTEVQAGVWVLLMTLMGTSAKKNWDAAILSEEHWCTGTLKLNLKIFIQLSIQVLKCEKQRKRITYEFLP